MNEIVDLNKIHKFEDLQKASFILRKALKDIRQITNGPSTLNSLNLSSSSNGSSISDTDSRDYSNILAFDNLTYSSSIESLQTPIQELKKTTLKSIKRKDKLKKVPEKQTKNEVQTPKKGMVHAKSMPSLDTIVLSNNEYEKQLRKLFRNKSLNRSLRRAKSVYYRNRRSKSLEDLTVEEKINFLMKTNSSYLKLTRSRSIDSCSSATSFISDISSSYFHELSDWSPEFSSSESESSEDGLFNSVDWENNFAFSGFNSSEESDSELDEENRIFKKDLIELRESQISPEQECLKEIITQKLDKDAETIENMLNEVMSRMLTIHPRLQKLSDGTQDGPKHEFLKYFQISNENLNDLNCFICLSNFELEDEAATLISCDHMFHKNCIQLWLSKSTNCPKCTSSGGLLERSNSLVSNHQRIIKRETLL